MHPTDKRLFGLAVPTLGALLAQPTFVLIDTAMVGHLGTPELAGLAVASTIITTLVGLLVFLAYATTAAVARAVGAGDRPAALRIGTDGLWFAAAIGVVAAATVMALGPTLLGLLGAEGDVVRHGSHYLWAAAPGIIGMLLVYAATGTLRGLSRVHAVLVVAVGGAATNVVLNAIFIYGLGWGLAGSGAGTAIAETLMAVVLVAILHAEARREGVGLAPTLAGFRRVGGSGWPLFVRTLSLRVSILVTVRAATSLGIVNLSAHQIVIAIWFLMANALDAIAIAAQTLVGESLGARRHRETRELLTRCVRWGTMSGAVLGLALAALAPVLPWMFTGDADVRAAATAALWVAAAGTPIGGLVYVLDGVLIGAGDGRYLAWTGVVNLATYLPFVVAVGLLAPATTTGLIVLWISYCAAYMGSRAATLGLRAAGTRWMVMGQ